MGLSKSALVGATVLPVEEVPVPELDGTVWVRGMSGTERDAFESGLWIGKGRHRQINTQNLRARLLAYCVQESSAGGRMFNDAEVDAIGRIRVDVLQRLFNVAQRLSGISDEDVEELGKKLPTMAGSDGLSS